MQIMRVVCGLHEPSLSLITIISVVVIIIDSAEAGRRKRGNAGTGYQEHCSQGTVDTIHLAAASPFYIADKPLATS